MSAASAPPAVAPAADISQPAKSATEPQPSTSQTAAKLRWVSVDPASGTVDCPWAASLVEPLPSPPPSTAASSDEPLNARSNISLSNDTKRRNGKGAKGKASSSGKGRKGGRQGKRHVFAYVIALENSNSTVSVGSSTAISNTGSGSARSSGVLLTDVTGRYTRGCADEVTLARGRNEGERWWWPFAFRECAFAAAGARDKSSSASAAADVVISLEPTTSGNTASEAIAVDEPETIVIESVEMSGIEKDEVFEDAAALAEESELKELAAVTAPLPNKLAAYKKHPTYALEAQLGR